MSGFLTIDEVAARTSYSPEVLRRLARSGLLRGARKTKRGWMIPATEEPRLAELHARHFHGQGLRKATNRSKGEEDD